MNIIGVDNNLTFGSKDTVIRHCTALTNNSLTKDPVEFLLKELAHRDANLLNGCIQQGKLRFFEKKR